jgi:hypothetical protein
MSLEPTAKPTASTGGAAVRMPPVRQAAPRKPQTFTRLQFECETTGGLVNYEVPSDAGTVKDLWNRKIQLNCSHCGEVHGFAFRPAFIRGALDAADVMTLSRDM